jgi:hypothetical protein
VLPADEVGRLDGEPFADGLIVELERTKAVTGPLTVFVRANRVAFKVIPREGEKSDLPITETQAAVVQALFADAYEEDNKRRLVLKRASMTPGR